MCRCGEDVRYTLMFLGVLYSVLYFLDEMERNDGYGASKLKIIGIARYGRFPLLGMRNGATVMDT